MIGFLALLILIDISFLFLTYALTGVEEAITYFISVPGLIHYIIFKKGFKKKDNFYLKCYKFFYLIFYALPIIGFVSLVMGYISLAIFLLFPWSVTWVAYNCFYMLFFKRKVIGIEDLKSKFLKVSSPFVIVVLIFIMALGVIAAANTPFLIPGYLIPVLDVVAIILSGVGIIQFLRSIAFIIGLKRKGFFN